MPDDMLSVTESFEKTGDVASEEMQDRVRSSRSDPTMSAADRAQVATEAAKNINTRKNMAGVRAAKKNHGLLQSTADDLGPGQINTNSPPATNIGPYAMTTVPKKDESPQSNDTTPAAGKKMKGIKFKMPSAAGLGMGANAILGALSGVTDTFAKMGDVSRKFLQGVLNPSATGTNEAKNLMGAAEGTANAAQSAVSNIDAVNKQYQTEKKNVADAKTNNMNAKTLKDLETFREEKMAELQNLPFEDWGTKGEQIEQELVTLLSNSGINMDKLDPNSQVGKWVKRFASEMKARANEQARERRVDRGESALNAKVAKLDATEDVRAKKRELDNIYSSNKEQLVTIMDDPNANTEDRVLAEVMLNIDPKGELTPTFDANGRMDADIDKKKSERAKKELIRMYNDEKDPARRDAIYNVYEKVDNRLNDLSDTGAGMAGQVYDSRVGDFNMPIDQVLKGQVKDKSSLANFGLGAPIDMKDAKKFVDVSNQRTAALTARILDSEKKLEQAQASNDAFQIRRAEAELDKWRGIYGKTVAYQNADVYLNKLEGDIYRNLRERTFTTGRGVVGSPDDQGSHMNFPDPADYVTLSTHYTDENGQLVPVNNAVLAPESRSYEQLTQDLTGYALGASAFYINRGKDILKDAAAKGLVGKGGRLGVHSGLDLTVGELIDAGIISKDDDFLDCVTKKDGLAVNPKEYSDIRIGDVIGRNVAEVVRSVDGEASKYLHTDKDKVGLSINQILNGIWSNMSNSGILTQGKEAVVMGKGPSDEGDVPLTVDDYLDRTYIGPGSSPGTSPGFSDRNGRPIAVKDLKADDMVYARLTYPKKDPVTGMLVPLSDDQIIANNTISRMRPLKFLRSIIDSNMTMGGKPVFNDKVKADAKELYKKIISSDPINPIDQKLRRDFDGFILGVAGIASLPQMKDDVFGTKIDRMLAQDLGFDEKSYEDMLANGGAKGTEYYLSQQTIKNHQEDRKKDPNAIIRSPFIGSIHNRNVRGHW